MIMIKSKSKPEVKFQYGGRLFLETGSSNISVVDWNVSIWYPNFLMSAVTTPEAGRRFSTL